MPAKPLPEHPPTAEVLTEMDTELAALFCEQRDVKRGYAITRDGTDFGVVSLGQDNGVSVLKIPAPLACYWLGQSEVAAG